MQIAKAAAASGLRGDSAGLDSPGSRGSPSAYVSIASSSIRTRCARSATQAQPARTSSGRETGDMEKPEIPIREATVEDAAVLARLLHDFNVEFEAETPGVEELTR